MDSIVAVALFWFGAIFGSFAGATAWRIRKKKDFVRDRSECEHCHRKLNAVDLIPLFSWLVLRGKCRYCKKPIGVAAFAIELLLGVAFLSSYLLWPFGFASVSSGVLFGLWLVCLVLMAILFVYDLRWSELPDKIVWPLVAVSFIFFVVRMISLQAGPIDALFELISGLMPIAGVYGLLYALSRGSWVGFGDVKLGIALGLLLGWQYGLVALVLANLLGFIYVVPLLVIRKVGRSSRVPFGPFLIIAAVIAQLFGSTLIEAYLRFIVV